ncbi:MAG: immunoglobulin domain-containing protein [Verrucomicrobiota bacterium]
MLKQTLLSLLSVSLFAGAAELSAPFTGPGLVHLTYSASASGAYSTGLKLVRVNGQTRTVLAQGTAIHGTLRVDKLPSGYTDIRIEESFNDTSRSPALVYTNLVTSISPGVTESNISGTLLFNETFSGITNPLVVGVNITNGLSLLLQDCSSVQYCSFNGNGNYSIGNCRVLGFNPPASGTLAVADSQFESVFNLGAGLMANFLNCKFPTTRSGAGFYVNGTNATPIIFEQCEFGMAPGVCFYGGRPVTLRGNMFAGGLIFTDKGWGTYLNQAVIENNSFVGVEALTYTGTDPITTKVALGKNYYGDTTGPNNWGFASGRGASVNTNFFAISKASFTGADLANRKFSTGTNLPPILYNMGTRIAQNVSGSLLRQGRETLVSVEIASNWKQVSGVQVYALLDGVRIDPVKSPDIYRDWRDCAAKGGEANQQVRAGATTFNLILPAQTKMTAALQVIMNTSNSPAFGTNGYQATIYSQTLNFWNAPVRPLRVLVTPVKIEVAGYPTGIPTGTAVAATLRKVAPAMLPIRSDELVVELDTLLTYSSAESGFFDSWMTASLCYTVNEWLLQYMLEINAFLPAAQRYDRIVGVVAKGTLGEGDGVNVMTSRASMLVDETKPLAVLHEMGHSFGLYTGKEEYSIVEGGYPVDQVTAFLPEAALSLNGVPGMTNLGRFFHLAQNLGDKYTDVMGSLEPSWIIPSTHYEYGRGLLSLLYSPSPAPAITQNKAASKAPVNPGQRRILMQGAYARLGSPWPWDANLMSYVLIRDTVTAMDVTDLNVDSIPSYNGGKADSILVRSLNTNYGYLDSQYVKIPGPDLLNSPIGFWIQTFDITNTAAGLSVEGAADPEHVSGDPYLMLDFSKTPSVIVTSPRNGDALGDTFNFTATTSGAPVSHLLFYSTDGSAWTRFGRLIKGNQRLLSAGPLPITNRVFLKVCSSDGFHTVINVISNLSVVNRSPQVAINQPRSGQTSGPVCDLYAVAADIEDGELTNLVWTSSLDGTLGTGPALPGIKLSAGLHTIACTATDRAGASNTARLQLTVAGNAAATDPRLETNSLVVVSGSPGTLPFLSLGHNNQLRFTVLNGGNPAAGTLQIFIQPPGGSEYLLQTNDLYVEDTVQITARLTPEVAGGYTVRALLTNVVPADANLANNEIRWTLSTQPVGVTVQIEPAAAVQAGAQWRVESDAWNASAATLSDTNFPGYTRLINFKPIPGWITPLSYYVDNVISDNTVFKAKYRPYLGKMPYVFTTTPFREIGSGAALYLSFYADGTPKPNYQWFKDGVALVGSNTTSVYFKNIQPSQAGTYTLVASNVVGLSTSIPIKVVVTNSASANTAPVISAQPVSQFVLPGGSAAFSVTASGLAPFSYRWARNGTVVVGASNATCVISNATTAQAGTYQVIITNTLGSVTSAPAMLIVDGAKPTVVISAPLANARVSNATVTVSGKAADTGGPLAAVCYRLNQGNWLSASQTTNWQAAVSGLTPGTNVIQTYGRDLAGNCSSTNTVKVCYVVTNLLQVINRGTGLGKTAPFTNNLLELGKTYTLTATPLAGSLFSNWVCNGVALTNKPVVQLTLRSNTTLTANFVTNAFLSRKGDYVGLFMPGDDFSQADWTNSGVIKLTMTDKGTFTGQLTHQGKTWPLTGVLDLNGATNLVVLRGKDPALQVSLSLDLGSQGEFVGTVAQGTNWLAGLWADMIVKQSVKTNYSLTVQTGPGGTNGGRLTLLVQSTGTVTVNGTLSDKNTLAGSFPLTRQREIIPYQTLYTGKGMWLGYISLQGTNGGAAHWQKLSNSLDKVNPQGFSVNTRLLLP